MHPLESIRHASKRKLAFAGAIVLAALLLVFYNPYDQEYFEKVEEEVKLARQICENSTDWVAGNTKRLKLDKNKLDYMLVDGKKITVEFEYIKTPRAIFFHTGYKHKGSKNEFYCTFSDPRGTSKDYFYDYDLEMWVDKTRTRR